MNGSSDGIGKLTHRQAFEWLQQEKDGRLDDASRLILHKHLQACLTCRQEESFLRRLPGLMQVRTIDRRVYQPDASDRQIIQAAQSARKRQRWLVQPVQGIAWAAMAMLLALVIGWGIERLQPGSASPAASVPGWLFSSPAQPVDVKPAQIQAAWKASLTDAGLILAGFIVILFVLLFAFRGSLVGKLSVLLAGLAGSMGLFLYFAGSSAYQGSAYYALLFLPLVALLLDIFFAYLWFNRTQWSVITWLILFFSMIFLGVILTSAWFRYAQNSSFNSPVLLIVLGFGLIPLLIWIVLDLPGRWRWITISVATVWILGAMLFLLATYAANIYLPGWLSIAEQVAGALYPFFAAAATGWLIVKTLVEQTLSRKDIFLRLSAELLLFASLFAVIRMMAIETSTNEDPISGVALLIFAVLGAAVGWTAMSIRLVRKRFFVGAALLAVFISALIPALLFSPEQSAVVTQQRADLINQAIQRYHQEKGIYPPSLDALSPGYLLLVPRPVANLTNEWCYVSGGDYYRLGYPYPTKFAFPGSVIIVEINGGNLPSGTSACEIERNRWIEARYR